MARLIDVDSAVKAISRLAEDMSINDRAVALLLALELNNEDRFPTADAVPVVHGYWIRGEAYPHHIFCSRCYRTYVPNDESEMWKDRARLPRKYCPECGAKMDEVTE